MVSEACYRKEVIEYDRYGRMEYNPIYFKNTGRTWSKDDLDYLINWYDKISHEEMAFALERTEGSIYVKITNLKKEGVIPRKRRVYSKKLLKKEPSEKGPK